MPKVRAKNERSGIADLGAHHSYKAPRFPAPRTTSEDFCRVYHNFKVSLLNNQAVVRNVGKALVRRQSPENIEKLNVAKGKVSETKDLIMSHLIECETCK